MIKREHYIKDIRGFYDSDLIKIITGIRRCGKSIILEQIRDELKEKTNNVIYLNFEDETVLGNIPSCEKLLEYVFDKKKEGLCYVFLDEIQEVSDWAKACKTLRLHNISLFITGSNSKILSREFTKEFSGRYVSFRIRPFVYKEILDYIKDTGVSYSISDYIVWGGFPKQLEFDRFNDRVRYLNEIYSSIVSKDLIVRFNIKNVDLFKRITNYVLRSNSRIFSGRSIEKYLKNEKIKGSINTIVKYIDYLEQAYIIDRIKPYSSSTKKELSYYFKVYNSDVSFNSIFCMDNRYDVTHNLENIVYNELLYMGYSVNVFSNENKEIDFLAIKDNKKYYVQVAYSVFDDKTYDREFGAFNNMDNSGKKILITNDDIDYSTSVVEHIKLKDFLVMDSLD
jgi:uncharacterized protein